MSIIRGSVRFLATAVLAIAMATTAFAEVPKVNTEEGGLAIDGYDPVAYFEMSKAVEGSAKFTAAHDSATYRFVSQHHLELFEQDPNKFVPAYGGYCSFGMRYGQTSKIDPKAWKIVDGRLYLQHDQGTQAVWMIKVGENISIADLLWRDLTDD